MSSRKNFKQNEAFFSTQTKKTFVNQATATADFTAYTMLLCGAIAALKPATWATA
jgi:hypothetical protein